MVAATAGKNSASAGQARRVDTRTQIIAPKYLPGYGAFNSSGFDNPTESLVLEPGPFEPPPNGGPGGPSADFRELIALAPSEHHAISALDGAPPLGAPAPGRALLIALSAAGLTAPRRRNTRWNCAIPAKAPRDVFSPSSFGV